VRKGGNDWSSKGKEPLRGVAFPPFSREDLVFALGIVETKPLRKVDHAGFVDPKLPPPFPPSKGVVRVGYLSGTAS
jgi:hypothetical protein